jgi:Asp-tRNA(Asn)/Glu-tRNA(Gln) amidotransferase A subunit family amidase
MMDLRGRGPTGLNTLDVTDAAARIAAGEITSEALVADCLDRIAACDDELRAWAFVDPELALSQARRCDAVVPSGPLHGVPVGIKDILDTDDMPTEYGSVIHKGHRPTSDTNCVAVLRQAGAVILGKTATTEFASPVPIGVRNPHNFRRSPGVSSSGSAAAVADFMVPVALGTQTGGSVILPSAFCGVFGFKGSLNAIDRAGIRHLRPSLDTLGFMTRSAKDMAMVYGALTASTVAPRDEALLPKIALCRTPWWDSAEPETVTAIETAERELVSAGAQVVDVELPRIFDTVVKTFSVISGVEGGGALEDELTNNFDELNYWIKAGAGAQKDWSDDDYQAAQSHAERCRWALGDIFYEFDVILTASTGGEATDDLVEVSDSSFNRVWTLMHGPCVTIPAYTGPNDMPVGVQVVGRPGDDAKVIEIAGWIARHL